MSVHTAAAVQQRITAVERQLTAALYVETIEEAVLLLGSQLRHEAHVSTLMPLRNELEFLRLRKAALEKDQ